MADTRFKGSWGRTGLLASGLLVLACGGCGNADLQRPWQEMGGRAVLNEHGEVESLYLGQTRITDSELAKLLALRQLKRLFLNQTGITDEGLRHLRKLDRLVFLDLDQTVVSDAGIPHLLELKNLRSLNLLDTRVTAVGLARLEEELPRCRVASLIVHDPGPGPDLADDGIAGSYQLIEDLVAKQLNKPFEEISQSELDQLRTLYLVDDNIVQLGKATDLVALQVLIVQSRTLRDLQGLEKLSQLTKLTVHAGSQVDDLVPLSHLEFLTELQLQYCRLHDLVPLQGLPRLEVLDLRESEVSNLEPLKYLKSLQKLWLPGNQVTDLKPLRELSQLKDLRITGNPIKSLAGIYELESLERLDIRGTEVSEDEIERFKAALPACKVYHDGKSR